MVFSFTFFTYNGQRLFRLREQLPEQKNLSERLHWIIRNKNVLIIFTFLFGVIGIGCTFFIQPNCWILIIPLGIVSSLYVLPLFPYLKKWSSLRELPYLKIVIIGLAWSFLIVLLPFIDSQVEIGKSKTIFFAFLQNFLFIIAITLPFDIRDLNFDKAEQIKTIPQWIGIKKTILLSEILLCCSLLSLFISEIKTTHFYSLFIGYLITMILIANTNSRRKELFYAGLIEGTVLIIYSCVLIAD